MKNRLCHRRQDLFIGIMIGATIGAAAAAILARSASGEAFLNRNKFLWNHKRQPKEKALFWINRTMNSFIKDLSQMIFTPQATARLRRSLAEGYEEISDRTSDLIENIREKSEHIAEVISSRADEWTEKVTETTDTIAEEIQRWASDLNEAAERAKERGEERGLHPRYQEKIEEVLEWSAKVGDKAEEMKENVRSWVESLQNATQRVTGNRTEKWNEEEKGPTQINDIVEWALVGFNLWKDLKRERE